MKQEDDSGCTSYSFLINGTVPPITKTIQACTWDKAWREIHNHVDTLHRTGKLRGINRRDVDIKLLNTAAPTKH
jgi:hypothetical protein